MIKGGTTLFWRGKRVLITGYEGFLGSWLTRTLAARGADVVGLDIVTHRRETILTAADFRAFESRKGSVEDYGVLQRMVRKQKTEIVFHLAASAIVGDCLKNPREAFSTNIQGTWNVLEACRTAGTVKAVVVASSDKAYGHHQTLPYDEEMALQGRNPYDVSKSCADLLALSYAHTYGLPVAVTRCGNIYGPGDFHFSRIVPEAIRCALTGKTLLIRSDGKFTRDYIYIGDIVAGYLSLAHHLAKEKKIAGQAFNFSDEHPLSVLEIIRVTGRCVRKGIATKILDSARFEIRDQYLASGKARRLLGWKPKVSLQEGIASTVAWFRLNY